MQFHRERLSEFIELVHGDCLEVLPTLVKGEFDACISDPPYGMANDCDYTRFTMGPKGHGKASSRFYDPIIGDDKPFDPLPWIDFPKVVLWGSNHFGANLPVGTSLVWIKRFDGGFGSFLSDAELAWMKGGHGVYCQRDTSLMGETHDRTHPTQKPIGLMRWCIGKAKVPAGGRILDPFAGSGTTGIAAAMEGRHCLLIEKDAKYCQVIRDRVARYECQQPGSLLRLPTEADLFAEATA